MSRWFVGSSSAEFPAASSTRAIATRIFHRREAPNRRHPLIIRTEAVQISRVRLSSA